MYKTINEFGLVLALLVPADSKPSMCTCVHTHAYYRSARAEKRQPEPRLDLTWPVRPETITEYQLQILQLHCRHYANDSSSGDEIANVNFL